ncbi:hypothetical protein AAHH78_41560, partial [Burkholderia pseudomallei]
MRHAPPRRLIAPAVAAPQFPFTRAFPTKSIVKSAGSARATRRNAVSSSSPPAHAEPPARRAATPPRKLDGAAARPL